MTSAQTSAALLSLLLAATAPGIAFPDCIDYQDYLHSVGKVATPGGATGVAVSGNFADVAREVFWDGRNDRTGVVPAGIYLYELDAPGFRATRRMVKLR